MYTSLGANFSTSSLFRFDARGGGQKAKRLNGSAACATFCVSTSVYTFEKRHEGICHISHAVDTSASSELKAR